MSESNGSVAVQELRRAIDARSRAEIDEAVAIAAVAAEYEWTGDETVDVVGTRPVRIGADGAPMFNEFLPLEIAALKGISVGAATWLIRDIVNLTVRHPLLWAQARRGLIPVFRAVQLVQEAARVDLTLEQARALDELLAPRIAGLTWGRVLKLARGLIAEVAAPKIAELAQRAREARFVRKLPTDDPLVAYLSCRVDTRDAIFFDAMIARIADVLAARGDTDPLDVRRAKAVGILATPARAQLMLQEAAGAPANMTGTAPAGSTDPRLVPAATVYVHIAEETLLTGRGTVRVEEVGALPATLLAMLLGHDRITLAPVIRPYAQVAVDSYEIPERIRNQVMLRDTVEVFPYSSRSPRRNQLDHTVPWRPRGKGQTRASNLGPLSTKAHRGKTHGGWKLEQPKPGIFWWESPAGQRYRTGPNGTFRYHPLTWHLDHRKKPEPPESSP